LLAKQIMPAAVETHMCSPGHELRYLNYLP
jgi:hypothetical protein